MRCVFQPGDLVAEGIIETHQCILHAWGGLSLRNAHLVLGDPQRLKHSILVVAAEGECLGNTVLDLHNGRIRRRRTAEKRRNETLRPCSSHAMSAWRGNAFRFCESGVITHSREPMARFGGNLGVAKCSHLVLLWPRHDDPLMLFGAPHEELTDEEVAAVLPQSMASAGRLPRHADVWLAGICAEHLVDGLRAAGLVVSRPVEWRLHR
jgi:hypothetical protein